MTNKELLYIEDALGHAKYFQAQCAESANKIQDSELKNFVSGMVQKHQTIFSSFYNLL